MKIVMANLILATLIVLNLMFTGISTAEFDLKTLAGMWLFDEGKGDTATDSSENGKDGELVNAPKWTKNGKFGSALEFDGNESKGTHRCWRFRLVWRGYIGFVGESE